MNEYVNAVYRFLDGSGIVYERMEHAPVHTIEDCAPIAKQMNTLIPKNYFLCTRNKKTVCLCVVSPDARFDSSSISAQAGTSRLSFGSAEMMQEYLHVEPGAVTPLSLIFDQEHRVKLLIDEQLLNAEKLAFHPCTREQTVSMNGKDFFEKFLPMTEHEVNIVRFL